MLGRLRQLTFVSIVTMLLPTAFLFAADLAKALDDAESRRRAAESGAKAIQAKAPAQLDQIKALYVAAADAHNSWLDATIGAVSQSGANEAVNTAAAKAASTIAPWVVARNQALGEPVLSGALATAVETDVRRNLIDIATEATKKYGRDLKKRDDALKALKERLHWKAWADIR